MRTNIEIDDKLMKKAMNASGAGTKKAAVEAGLRMLVKSHEQQAIRELFGKIEWEGDLESSRTNDKWENALASEHPFLPAKAPSQPNPRTLRKKAA